MNLRTACSPNLSQSEILIWKRTKENKFWAAKHSVKGIWCNAAVNMVLSHPFWNWHYIQNEHIICRNRILQIYSLCHCFIKKHAFGGGKFINLKKNPYRNRYNCSYSFHIRTQTGTLQHSSLFISHDWVCMEVRRLWLCSEHPSWLCRCGAVSYFPQLVSTKCCSNSARSHTAADGASSSHLFGAYSLYTELASLERGG